MSISLFEQDTHPLQDKEFQRIQGFLYSHCGIHLNPVKKPLVASRLYKRLKHYALHSYGDYFDLATQAGNATELTTLVDCLTTNETYFFREPEHFHFLSNHILAPRPPAGLKIWSAACSSGEEVYSLAMVLADALGMHGDWRVTGTDISTKVLASANAGHYPMERNEGISPERLRKYCLKGVGSQQGTFLIDPALRSHVVFKQHNLMHPPQDGSLFDVIFIRNVMIYFNQQSKQQVMNQVLGLLKTGGYLFISHTESLFGIQTGLQTVSPAVYRKVPPCRDK
jgi:chemotaxis protein methyltransferase CheR